MIHPENPQRARLELEENCSARACLSRKILKQIHEHTQSNLIVIRNTERESERDEGKKKTTNV